MDQLKRYFISRIVGPGMVIVAINEDGKGSVHICCEETDKLSWTHYCVNLTEQQLKAPSCQELLYQICRQAISQFQQEARSLQSVDRNGVLDLTITPWNGDLNITPPLLSIGWIRHKDTERVTS
jgi:hypothetical protein